MKIAVVVSGWHFPLHFYERIAAQKLPSGWSVDLFCVSHRDPHHSAEEKKVFLTQLGWSHRETLDRILYEKIATVEDIRSLGWTYMLEPNTVGDMGNINQWLEKYDYKKYDMLLISHDDNLILNDRLYSDLLTGDLPWLILTNSTGSPPVSLRERVSNWNKPIPIRGSFEFMKRELFDLIGGKFDLSEVTLSREGETSSGIDQSVLRDWNNTTRPLVKIFERPGMKDKIRAISPYYRMSRYCLEGERGFISVSIGQNAANRRSEDNGLALIEKTYSEQLLRARDS